MPREELISCCCAAEGTVIQADRSAIGAHRDQADDKHIICNLDLKAG